jgi:CRISPR-associated protein Csb3
MAEARIPVDLRNPGQVFACLGLMEAAEILFAGAEVTGGYCWEAGATQAQFRLDVTGVADPVLEILRFLQGAEAVALAPEGSELRAAEEGVATAPYGEAGVYPCPPPKTPAALPAQLRCGGVALPLGHWADGRHIGRDNVKFWAGAGGYSGAALARDGLEPINGLGDNASAVAATNPFAFTAPQTSSFRFDWRRDYVPRDLGFSPNDHKSAMTMQGYPLVELLAAAGLEHARPRRLENKLHYRYGVSDLMLPTALARPVLGAQAVCGPIRIFSMTLGWPGKEGQARCIINAIEVSNQEDERR